MSAAGGVLVQVDRRLGRRGGAVRARCQRASRCGDVAVGSGEQRGRTPGRRSGRGASSAPRKGSSRSGRPTYGGVTTGLESIGAS